MAASTRSPRPDGGGFTIDEFCAAYRISRGTFYNRLKEGKGPRVMRIGARRVISYAAAEDYRRELEGAGDAA